jgi:hypothetical protein
MNIAEKFLSGGGLRKMVLSDDEQKQLLGAVARHLRVLQEIPDFLPHLRVDKGRRGGSFLEGVRRARRVRD